MVLQPVTGCVEVLLVADRCSVSLSHCGICWVSLTLYIYGNTCWWKWEIHCDLRPLKQVPASSGWNNKKVKHDFLFRTFIVWLISHLLPKTFILLQQEHLNNISSPSISCSSSSEPASSSSASLTILLIIWLQLQNNDFTSFVLKNQEPRVGLKWNFQLVCSIWTFFSVRRRLQPLV